MILPRSEKTHLLDTTKQQLRPKIVSGYIRVLELITSGRSKAVRHVDF